MKNNKVLNAVLKTAAAIVLICGFLLTFTVSDYYIFNRIGEFNFFFCISQWVKKAGLLLIPLAVFYNRKSCSDLTKYVLPLFVILSCCLFGNFFDATPVIPEGDVNREIFNSLNLFFPKWLNITLFFIQNAAMLVCCAGLFFKDGYKVSGKSFIYLAPAIIICMPLNLFENFFDINSIPADSFLRFHNFTIWHFIALAVLVGFTVGGYYFLKKKSREKQDIYLTALAIALLIQYHSKDSVVLGDGYNVYHTIFACIPLFICNIGVYVASLSVILKKRALYAISFFIHAIGALTVFIYFGKDEMSNYGIFCSYSILYFCLTHCFLFALCVLPSALGHYKFKIKDCIIPLVYYFIVIILASLASTLISSLSVTWQTADGEHLIYDGVIVTGDLNGNGVLGEAGFMAPNYAFTQNNPLPFKVPNLIPLGGVFKYINMFYVLLVYIVYVALFFAFNGVYYAFIAIRKKILSRVSARANAAEETPVPTASISLIGEYAATEADGEADENGGDNSADKAEKKETDESTEA